MELEELKRLLRLMDENGLAELEVEEEGRRIRLRKHEVRAAVAAAPAPVPHPPAAGNAHPAFPAGPHAAPPALPDNQILFKSPLVGTFYRSPKPDSDPFVEVGDHVTADKVICIVEAMKVMNEIKAEVDGVIKEILAKNGQAAEYGEPLFVIEKR